MLACLWRHVYGVQLPFWDAKELRFCNFRSFACRARIDWCLAELIVSYYWSDAFCRWSNFFSYSIFLDDKILTQFVIHYKSRCHHSAVWNMLYYKLRCNSTQFVINYKLRNYYKLQRNREVHGAFATGFVCLQGRLTCSGLPLWNFDMLLFLRAVFPKPAMILSTFSLRISLGIFSILHFDAILVVCNRAVIILCLYNNNQHPFTQTLSKKVNFSRKWNSI